MQGNSHLACDNIKSSKFSLLLEALVHGTSSGLADLDWSNGVVIAQSYASIIRDDLVSHQVDLHATACDLSANETLQSEAERSISIGVEKLASSTAPRSS